MEDKMRALIWNNAIDAALNAYPYGRGSILELKKKFYVTVEHVGEYSTKQEYVEIVTDDPNQG